MSVRTGTPATSSRGYVALRPSLAERVRAAAAGSVIVRTLLLGSLAIAVTVGGVAAGALVVAPVVASATRPDRSASLSKSFESAASAAQTALGNGWRRLDHGTTDLLERLPEPVARYALPTVAVVAITGALLALFLPSRDASSPHLPIGVAALTPARGMARLTPKSTARVSGRKRSPSAVEALAASGTSAAEIAWKTGLPLDAVQLLLAISSGPRQLHPPTA